MVSASSSFGKLLAVPVILALLVIPSGCIFSPDEKDPDPITLPDRDTPEGAIAFLARVWELKSYQDYEKVLHESFEFWPLQEDANALPWMTGDSWVRTEELLMAQNMFDPGFEGSEQPVESIEWEFSILNQQNTKDADGADVVEFTVHAFITVLTGENSGFRSDTHFRIDVIADPGEPGQYQVKRQEEILAGA